MDWKPTEDGLKAQILTNKLESGGTNVIARIERLPSGSWKWTVYESARLSPSSGTEPTQMHAERAVESIVAPPVPLPPVEHIYIGTDEIKNLNTPAELRSLFANRNIEEDTLILAERYCKIEGIPVLEEAWSWDGFKATALILPKRYLISLTESDVLTLLSRHFDIPDRHTYSNHATSHFVFVNYGFVSED